MSHGTSSAVAPGTVLAGKYRVEKLLGQGGMGVVVQAQHIQLDERVALKFLTAEWATHPEAAERFLREARAAVRIKNEHVARVSDVGTLETGSPYMVMEYLEGKDLGQILEKTGPMQLGDAVDYLIQGCEAIAEAHGMGIVHRDLKPANLFLTKHPDGSPLVKVLDFGISKQTGGAVDNLTRTTATMGSALYMSPEQMQQSRNVDHRTDVYALGVTLYELLAGKQPYYAETLPQLCAEILTGTPTPLRDLRPDIPPDFAYVLEKAYARDRNIRYQNIAEYVFALAPYAPQRSQGSIDRVARLSGQQPPRAGAPPAVPPGPLGQPGGDRLVVGAYAAAPPSARAAAAFASSPEIAGGPQQPYGPSTGHPGYQSSGSLGSHSLGTSQVSPPPKSKTPVVVAAILAALLGCAVALYFVGGLAKPKPAEATPATSAPAPTPPAPETAKAEPPAPPPSAAATPEPPSSASAATEPSAAPSAAAAAPPPGKRPAAPPSKPPAPGKTAATPAAPPAPPPPAKPPSAGSKDPFGDR